MPVVQKKVNQSTQVSFSSTERRSLRLEEHFRIAAQLWKKSRLRDVLGKTGFLCAGLSLVFLLCVLIDKNLIRFFPLFFYCLSVLIIIILTMAILWPVSTSSIIFRMDALCQSKDTTMAAWQLKSWERGDFWGRQITRQAEDKLLNTPWPELWPLQWAKYSGTAVVLFLVLYTALVAYYLFSPSLEENLYLSDQNPVHTADAFNFSEYMLKVPDGMDEETWGTMEAPVRELAKQLLTPDSNKETILMSLNKLEDQISALQEQLSNESLEEMSDEIASALEMLKGSSEAVQKIRDQEYKESAESLNKMAEKFRKDKSGKPMARNPEKSAIALEELAQKMKKRGNQGMQKALDQLSQGSKNNNPEQMSSGLEDMSREMQNESLRQQQASGLSQKQSSLDQIKQNIQQGKDKMEGMKQPSELKKPGDQWGMGSDDNPFSEKTSLAANLEKISVSGKLGEGESRLSREKVASGSPAAISEDKNITLEEYKNLSQQTVEDESIPLSHRSVIQEYFQQIRLDDSTDSD